MTDPLIDDYLYRLDAAARVLPDDRRRELVDEIAAHISQSWTGGRGEAELRTVLDRLGDPAEIVAAAVGEEDDDSTYVSPGLGGAGHGAGGYGAGGYGAGPFSPQFSADGSQVRELRPPRITIEIAAALLLTVGSIVPVVGWAAGVVLVWLSRRWRTWEKVLATLVFPGGPGLALIVGTIGVGTTSCSSSSGAANGSGTTVTETCRHTGLPIAVGAVLFALWVVTPIVIAIVLVVRARNRAASEPPVEHWRPVSQRSLWGLLEAVSVGLLIVGAFVIPIVGPLAGLVCLWASRAWTSGEKTVATAIAAVPAVAWLAVLATGSFAPDVVFGWVSLSALALSGLAPAAAGILLAIRLSARRTAPAT